MSFDDYDFNFSNFEYYFGTDNVINFVEYANIKNVEVCLFPSSNTSIYDDHDKFEIEIATAFRMYATSERDKNLDIRDEEDTPKFKFLVDASNGGNHHASFFIAHYYRHKYLRGANKSVTYYLKAILDHPGLIGGSECLAEELQSYIDEFDWSEEKSITEEHLKTIHLICNKVKAYYSDYTLTQYVNIFVTLFCYFINHNRDDAFKIYDIYQREMFRLQYIHSDDEKDYSNRKKLVEIVFSDSDEEKD